MVAMVTGMCRSAPIGIYSIIYIQHKVVILKNSSTSFEKCQIGKGFERKKATKMKNC